VSFNDNAPPATEQQRKDAQDYLAKAKQARERMESIGKALRGTAQLQASIRKSGSSAAATDILKKQLDT